MVLFIFRNLKVIYGSLIIYLIFLPALALFFLFSLVPMMYCFLEGLKPTSLSLYGYILRSRLFRDLLFTIGVGMLTATLSFVLSIPISSLLRKNVRGKSIIQALLFFPLVVPELIAGYSIWLTLMPHGLLYNLFRITLNLSLPPLPDWLKLIVACTWKYFPMMTLMVAAGMEAIDPDLELAARSVGASPLRTFFAITLPLLIPSLISGYTLVFLRAAGQFSITLVIGGARLTTIPIDIWYQYQLANMKLSYVLATMFTFVMVALVILFTRALRGMYRG